MTTPVAEIVARARGAQAAWAARTLRERLRIIECFRREAFAARGAVAEVIVGETGKPVAEAMAAEVATVLELARYYVRQAHARLAPRRFTSATPALFRKQVTEVREPHGVVGVIAPWNYPFLLPAGVLLPAIAAGNAVVLKPSELTLGTAALLVELLHRAGVPTDILGLLPGDAATGRALVESDIDKLFFTGSSTVGRQVAVRCAERGIPVSLELGGSDAAIVLRDADLDVAVRGIVWGRFANAGQTCVAPKRVFVEAAIYAEFVARVERAVRELRVAGAAADEVDMGPLISAQHAAVVRAQLEDARTLGATIHTVASGNAGATLQPALVLDAPPASRVLREEVFGPVLPIVQVRDATEAVDRANETTYGLSASIWTRDRRRARALAAELQAGSVVINDVALVAGVAEIAHGGVKGSGWGRAHGLAGLDECVRLKTILDDRLVAPQPWWFPYRATLARDLDGYLRLTHGASLRDRLAGLAATARLLRRILP